MGYYIQVPENTHKAEQLVALHGAMYWSGRLILSEVPKDKALICVVENGPFDAAALIFNEGELDAFSRPNDLRPREWLVMDKVLAHKLSGYKGEQSARR